MQATETTTVDEPELVPPPSTQGVILVSNLILSKLRMSFDV